MIGPEWSLTTMLTVYPGAGGAFVYSDGSLVEGENVAERLFVLW